MRWPALCRPLLFLLCSLLLALLGVACRVPQDPMGTLDEVQGGTLRVGVAENPPWVIGQNDEPAGVEAALVRALAEELNSEVAWLWGSEEDILEAAVHFEVDLVIAGLTNRTPWKGHVALTTSYYTVPFVVGVPREFGLVETVQGMTVAVEQPSPSTLLKEQGAAPRIVRNLAEVEGPIAAPAWRVEQLGLVVTDVVLEREHHVMAVPPGENRWLMHVDEFLYAREAAVEELLRQEAGQ